MNMHICYLIEMLYYFCLKYEKEIESLKNELMMYKHQKEMIGQLKIELNQSKERVLSLEQRLQSECISTVANYVDQLDKLKDQYDEKVKNKTKKTKY